jgi:L,D-transpeptidase ErfK/SrfK
MKKQTVRWVVGLAVLVATIAVPYFAHAWNEADFGNRPLYAYPIPRGQDAVIGSLTTYKLQPRDTLLDVGRWFGLSSKEVSDANNHMDWWSPPAGREIVLPSEHILPSGPRVGIVLNIPEMRLYYYYPSPMATRHRGKLRPASFSRSRAQVVYTFPVGLGRFDWKTPVANWSVVAKTRNPTWVVPQDIYEEHLERDGEAEHMVPGGDPDNPLGRYRLSLSLPEYALHGTDVPWGVGMNVSHGCVRLYPEDIERLFSKVRVGTPGRFVYQPVKFGWRGETLYVEVHDDLYAMYPGLWQHALQEVKRLGLEDSVDMRKLERAVEAKSGIPTDIMPGETPDTGSENAAAYIPAPVASAPASVRPAVTNTASDGAGPALAPNSKPASNDDAGPGGDWEGDSGGLPSHVVEDNSIE